MTDPSTSVELVNAGPETDWAAIARIFNHYAQHSPAAYPEQPVADDFFAAKHVAERWLPFLVARADDAVVGFGYLSPFHPAPTMRHAAALTYFLHPDWTGRGLGTTILQRLLAEGAAAGIRTFLAHISSLNEGSIRFHRRHGFTECGRFHRVGRKHGREFDMVWMERLED